MTDRFYPIGMQSADGVWKTTYEGANEMRSNQRSAYPPGYAGHEPGARDKFGYSTPGPDAARLTASSLCLRDEVDIPEPRKIMAIPRGNVDEGSTFRYLDVPEMDRSYKSGIVSPAHRSMAKSQSLPTIMRMKAPPRLSPIKGPTTALQDQDFTYFVPKGMNRESEEQLMSKSLSKLYKSPEKKVMLSFGGDGTGFRTSNAACDWWPTATSIGTPSSYQSAFQAQHFTRMSPIPRAARSDGFQRY